MSSRHVCLPRLDTRGGRWRRIVWELVASAQLVEAEVRCATLYPPPPPPPPPPPFRNASMSCAYSLFVWFSFFIYCLFFTLLIDCLLYVIIDLIHKEYMSQLIYIYIYINTWQPCKDSVLVACLTSITRDVLLVSTKFRYSGWDNETGKRITVHFNCCCYLKTTLLKYYFKLELACTHRCTYVHTNMYT